MLSKRNHITLSDIGASLAITRTVLCTQVKYIKTERPRERERVRKREPRGSWKF